MFPNEFIHIDIYSYRPIYYIGRGKPGWGKESTRPPWWPGEVPWANVRMDARPEDDKQRVFKCSIFINCVVLINIRKFLL